MATGSSRKFLLKNSNGAVPEVVTGIYLDEGAISEVFALPGGVEVVKEFRRTTTEERARVTGIARKVQAMLDLPPAEQVHHQGNTSFVQIAWPKRALVDERSNIIGFSMPRISLDAIPLSGVFSKRNRDRHHLRNDLAFRFYIALNLCTVIGNVHKAGHLVMDFNSKNFIVDKTYGWVGLIDCDGFAIWDGSRLIPAEAVKAEEVAPEFRAPGFPMNYDVTRFDERQMRFGLAVTLFKLLNEGNSPAAGKHLTVNEPSGDNARIAKKLFSVDPARAGLEPPGDNTHLLESETLRLFRQAFLGADNTRPSAAEWSAHLLHLTRKVQQRPVVSGGANYSKPHVPMSTQNRVQFVVPIPSAAPFRSVASSAIPITVAWWRKRWISCALLASSLAIFKVLHLETAPTIAGSSTGVIQTIGQIDSKLMQGENAISSPKTWAIAAIKGSLRNTPTDGIKIGELARGTLVEQLDQSETHVKIKTSEGIVGWLSREVIMDGNDLRRLSDLSANNYIELHQQDKRIELLLSQTSDSNEQLREVYKLLFERSPNIMAALERLDTSRKVNIPADLSAAKWFGYLGEMAAINKMFDVSRMNFVAAIQADPTNSHYHTGLAYSMYNAGDLDALKSSWRVLPVLAPKSTNTWFVAGLVLATDQTENPSISVAAFRLAYVLSRDPKTTRSVLLTCAANTKDERIRRAIKSAVHEIDAGSPAYSTPAAITSANMAPLH